MATLTTRLQNMTASVRDLFASPLGERHRIEGLPPRLEQTLPPAAPLPPLADPTPREMRATTDNDRFPLISEDERARTRAAQSEPVYARMAASTTPGVQGIAMTFRKLANIGNTQGPAYRLARMAYEQADALFVSSIVKGRYDGFANGAPSR